jgi:hypothetical protein
MDLISAGLAMQLYRQNFARDPASTQELLIDRPAGF